MKYLTLTIIFLTTALCTSHAQVDARMLRQPDVSRTHITFVYAGDVWIVPKQGGTAQRLSSPPGEESFPRFSPDGTSIAFSGNYDGNTDVYVVPAMGGELVRVTHHPMSDRLVDWHPDGQSLIYASSMESERQRFSEFYRTRRHGGMPEKLPIPYGEFGAISPDGRVMAYVPISVDFRTWKRYRGGMNPDIFLFNLETLTSENITRNSANDTQPMWHGSTLYFLSDRDATERTNIWAYDLASGSSRQVTRFTDFDIHFPAIGPEEIVFEAGGRLYLMDLDTETVSEVRVEVVTDRATLQPRAEKVADQIFSREISPTGKRAVIEARGDVFTVPAEHGAIINLTNSSGVAERYPAWSPDGKLVAYFTDRTGEYELAVRNADGTGEEHILTTLGPGYRYRLFWSPDGKKLAFIDQAMKIQVFDRDSKKLSVIDQALYFFQGALQSFTPSWSSDSRWLAYSRDLPNRKNAIYLYDAKSGRTRQATSGYYDDMQPAFDPEGKYLYFLSNRTLQPSYSDIENTWIYANTTNVVAVPLTGKIDSPMAPRNDEEGEEEVTDTTTTNATRAVEIDLDGFEERLVVLPARAGNYSAVDAAPGKVVYHRRPRTGSSEEKSPVLFFDLKEREEKTAVEDADLFELSADGKKLLVAKKGSYSIVDLAADQKTEKTLRTTDMEVVVDPAAEWRQIFNDVWRFQRDFFYDPDMHGVDWEAMRERYGSMLEDAVTRYDVNFIIGELIAELNASHTYRGGGDVEEERRRKVALLGVDWELGDGAYRVRHIVDGAPWDSEVRSPLRQSGVDVKEGDYILAVNGAPVDTSKDPWAAFQGLGGAPLVLTVNDRPTTRGARQVIVDPIEDETRLRHLEWIEANRRRTDEASGGRVGYIYVPSTGIEGQTELVRQFTAQFTKDALIIDERFNSGGQIPDRFIELLNRPALAYWAVRDGMTWQWPTVAHFGPKVMLINGWSGSGGDAFPDYFRRVGLGPLIGSRTWGGLIGLTGAPALIDGGGVTVPTFRMYSPTGEWFPEGHGVDPDIDVPEDPTALAKGVDVQLERGIQEALRLLEERPYRAPQVPSRERRVPVIGGQ